MDLVIGTVVKQIATTDPQTPGNDQWIVADGRALIRNGYPQFMGLVGDSFGPAPGTSGWSSATFNAPTIPVDGNGLTSVIRIR